MDKARKKDLVCRFYLINTFTKDISRTTRETDMASCSIIIGVKKIKMSYMKDLGRMGSSMEKDTKLNLILSILAILMQVFKLDTAKSRHKLPFTKDKSGQASSKVKATKFSKMEINTMECLTKTYFMV